MNVLSSIPVSVQTVLLLVASNVFMTIAWYGHLRSLATARAALCMMGAVYFIFRNT